MDYSVGQEVLVPGDFNFRVDEKGDVYLYPQGDMSVPPPLHMPASGRFFDATNRQKPYDLGDLSFEDNTVYSNLRNQSTLPYGMPAEVDRDVRKRWRLWLEAADTYCRVVITFRPMCLLKTCWPWWTPGLSTGGTLLEVTRMDSNDG